MDCCACTQFGAKSSILGSSPPLAGRSEGLHHPPFFTSFQPFRSSCPSLRFQGKAKFNHNHGFAWPRAPSLVAAASAAANEHESSSVGTPLELQTPEGKFLCGILKNHPHFFPAAALEQLEELASDRDNAFERRRRSAGSSESCLHGRIAEMKELECQTAIEEVMYLLVVHNFCEIKVPMIPNLSKCTTDGILEIWSSKDQELESIHGPDISGMVREHLLNILRWQGKSNTTVDWSSLSIKRLQLGRLYAASIMYGYFLKSVSLRHHLELSLPSAHIPASKLKQRSREENLVALNCYNDLMSSSLSSSSGGERRAEKLRGYVMGFDSKTLQICAKLRSPEAADLIERHTMALFGYPGKNGNGSDEVVDVSTSCLKRLVLEAVAFGAFLWDAEKYIDSIYKLKEN